MSTIVDIRPGRSGSACARLIEREADEAGHGAPSSLAESADIILFPTLKRDRLAKPRKRLVRRFQSRPVTAADA